MTIEPTKEKIDSWFAEAELPFSDFNNWTTDNFEIAARLAYAAGIAAERERCLYWCELGDKEGYATSHIQGGSPRGKGGAYGA